MDRILCFMFVFFGGGTGCLIRLLVDGTSTQAFSPSNVAACILIGVTYGTARYGIATNKFWLSFFNVGFLGGLSTFTPLAIYSLSSQQENIFLAIAVMLGLLLAYTAMTIASAALTSTAVKIFTHGRYQLKMQPRASMRYIFTYMQVAQAAVKIKSIYELQVKSTFPDGSVIEQQLNECRQVLGAIDLLEKQYHDRPVRKAVPSVRPGGQDLPAGLPQLYRGRLRQRRARRAKEPTPTHGRELK